MILLLLRIYMANLLIFGFLSTLKTWYREDALRIDIPYVFLDIFVITAIAIIPCSISFWIVRLRKMNKLLKPLATFFLCASAGLFFLLSCMVLSSNLTRNSQPIVMLAVPYLFYAAPIHLFCWVYLAFCSREAKNEELTE